MRGTALELVHFLAEEYERVCGTDMEGFVDVIQDGWDAYSEIVACEKALELKNPFDPKLKQVRQCGIEMLNLLQEKEGAVVTHPAIARVFSKFETIRNSEASSEVSLVGAAAAASGATTPSGSQTSSVTATTP